MSLPIRLLLPVFRLLLRANSCTLDRLMLSLLRLAHPDERTGRQISPPPRSIDVRGLLRRGPDRLLRLAGRPVGLEEGADVAQRELDLLRVRLPRIQAHLSVRREVRG